MSDNWTIVGTDASVKGLDAAGSVFTVSNGYLALRGSVPLNRTGKYPGTIIAGVFSEADMSSSIPPNGAECRYLDASLFDEPKYRPSVANLPDPMCLCVLVDGCELRFEDGEVSGFRQSLDLRTGEYTCEYELAVEQGTLAIRMSRFTCMERPHLAAMRCELTALDFNGMLSLRAGIDTTVRSNLHGEKQFDVVESAPDGVKVRLAGSGVEVKVRTATLEAGGRPRDSVVEAGGFHGVEWTLTSGDGSRLALEHFVSLSSSEDDAPLEEEVRP